MTDLQHKITIIHTYLPYSLGKVAELAGCHVNTIRKGWEGDVIRRQSILDAIDKLYDKAERVRQIVHE